MALAPRTPFAVLDTERLQSLSSTKNKQNAITSNIPPTLSSPIKSQTQSTGKRRFSPSSFDAEDSENIDPSIFNSPTKRSKTGDGLSKPSQFSLVASPSAKSCTSTATSPALPSVRKALSSPNTSKSTPISHSRGSPKHKRVGLLSKRRTSSSPFRRVDPPSFSRNTSPALPFSIDAALSGTIPSYTPKSALSNVQTLEESMPKSWFFEIHEDTPEQEAQNLMEHSANVLDISSDDDSETKRKNEELERGKENIPPPEHLVQITAAFQPSQGTHLIDPAPEPTKHPRLRKLAQDAMDEDRSPLSDLPASDFYAPGLDATSCVTVDTTVEKPSGLSKEFDFSCPTPETESPKNDIPSEPPVVQSIPIFDEEAELLDEAQDGPADSAIASSESPKLVTTS